MLKSLSILVLAVFCFAIAGCKTCGTASSVTCAGGVCKKCVVTSKSGLEIKVADMGASIKDGIELRIALVNKGENPMVFLVCPAMTLCCIKGMHPMIAYDDKGMGLLDVCKSAKSKKHTTVLPVGAELAFNVTIPPKCLPPECLKKGKQIKIIFCYDCDDAKQIASNEISVMLK